jgi:hypothetical protein
VNYTNSIITLKGPRNNNLQYEYKSSMLHIHSSVWTTEILLYPSLGNGTNWQQTRDTAVSITRQRNKLATDHRAIAVSITRQRNKLATDHRDTAVSITRQRNKLATDKRDTAVYITRQRNKLATDGS